MKIKSDRFGTIELGSNDVIRFPSGLIGFSGETEFALIPHTGSNVVAWLHSVKNGAFALPVVSAHGLGQGYPDVPLKETAERAGLGENSDELAVMAVLSAPPGKPATVNLLAPIIVNSTTRTGAQIVLEGSQYTTHESFVLAKEGDAAAEAKAR